jgi:hypothetical protein
VCSSEKNYFIEPVEAARRQQVRIFKPKRGKKDSTGGAKVMEKGGPLKRCKSAPDTRMITGYLKSQSSVKKYFTLW